MPDPTPITFALHARDAGGQLRRQQPVVRRRDSVRMAGTISDEKLSD